MIKIETTDGATFMGEDDKEIVRQMRNTQWNAPERKHDYMEEVVGRVASVTGVLFPGTPEDVTAETFLSYLEAAGMLNREHVQ